MKGQTGDVTEDTSDRRVDVKRTDCYCDEGQTVAVINNRLYL